MKKKKKYSGKNQNAAKYRDKKNGAREAAFRAVSKENVAPKARPYLPRRQG